MAVMNIRKSELVSLRDCATYLNSKVNSQDCTQYLVRDSGVSGILKVGGDVLLEEDLEWMWYKSERKLDASNTLFCGTGWVKVSGLEGGVYAHINSMNITVKPNMVLYRVPSKDILAVGSYYRKSDCTLTGVSFNLYFVCNGGKAYLVSKRDIKNRVRDAILSANRFGTLKCIPTVSSNFYEGNVLDGFSKFYAKPVREIFSDEVLDEFAPVLYYDLSKKRLFKVLRKGGYKFSAIPMQSIVTDLPVSVLYKEIRSNGIFRCMSREAENKRCGCIIEPMGGNRFEIVKGDQDFKEVALFFLGK